MKYNLRDIAEYTIAVINEFARQFNLTEKQAFRYLTFHRGLTFIEENYGIAHTLNFQEVIESVRLYCRNSGGKI